MFGLSLKSKKEARLANRMLRFINESCAIGDLAEQAMEGIERSDTRMQRDIPCALFLYDELEEPQCYAPAVSKDISLKGISVTTFEALELAEYVIVIGEGEDRMYLRAECKHCTQRELGAFSVGFLLTDSLSPQDCYAIARAARELEQSV